MKRKLHVSASLLTIMEAVTFSGCKKVLVDIATQEIAQG